MHELPANILVVDDMPENLQVLEQFLAKEGHHVCVALGGKPALVSALKRVPDLVLLDINMPDMDGLQVCRRFKADPALAGVPILFLSAYTDVAHKIDAFDVGGMDYVSKPFIWEEVRARINTQLRLHRGKRELEQSHARLQLAQEELTALNGALEERVALRTQQLSAAHLKAEMAQRAKIDFFFNMSLAARAASTDILHQTDVLLEYAGSPQERAALDGITGSAEHLLQMVNDMRDMMLIEAGSLVFDRLPFDLSAELKEEGRRWSTRAARQGVPLGLTADFPPPAPVVGDAVRVRQMVSALVDHAMRAADGRKIGVTLALDPSSEAGRMCLHVAVHDAGAVVSEGAPPLVPILACGLADALHFGTNAVGLAIAAHLAEKMNGRVWSEHVPNIGVTLHARCLLEAQLQEAPPTAPPREHASVDLQDSLRVLLVEADQLNRQVITLLLDQRQHDVEAFASAGAALPAVARQRFNVALVDMRPSGGGLKILEQLRAGEKAGKLARTRVVAIIDADAPQERERCLQVGADAVLTRPVAREALQRVVEGDLKSEPSR